MMLYVIGIICPFIVLISIFYQIIRKQRDEITELKKKEDLLALMSHEIRTPISGMIGTIQLIMDTKLTKKQKEFMANLDTASTDLLSIVNDILDFSKIESGKMILNKKNTDIKLMLKQVMGIQKTKASEKKLDFSCEFDIKESNFLIDSSRVKQILFNIIGNAIKFTHDGYVKILVTYDKTMLNFIVQDSGVGIENEQAKYLFKKYQQANKSISKNYGGTGLGLYISKLLAKLHGGDITFNNNNDNKGSEFIISIRTKICEEQKCVIEDNIINEKNDFSNLKILLAEDDRINAEFIKEILKGLKCNVVHVRNGQEVIETLQKGRKFDLILMDCNMPVMDGFEATRIIRDNKEFENYSIVALTANANDDDSKKCLKSGMDDYIKKPFNIERFIGILKKKKIKMKMKKK